MNFELNFEMDNEAAAFRTPDSLYPLNPPNPLRTANPNASIAPTAPKSAEDVKAILEQVQAKYRDGADQMSQEERKKHCDLLQHILRMVGSMEKELRQTVHNPGKRSMVLQIKNLPGDGKGSVVIPKKEEIERIFVDDKFSPRNLEAVSKIEVESVFLEWNFPHILSGPKSPNFTTKNAEVFVKFGSVEQAVYVQILGENKGMMTITVKREGCNHSFGIRFVPCPDATVRATYRNIGDLILRLKEVDRQLKALGAVPGRGGIPELSEMLVQPEDFEAAVTASGFNKATLHNYLCTRTRVDKRKRQAALDPLVDERIEILMALSQIDQDKFPFACEREFK